MTVAAWTFLALALAGSAYQLFGLAAVIRFFVHARRRWAGLPDYTPPVTVLKPLKGPGIDLFANLEGDLNFCPRLDGETDLLRARRRSFFAD